MINLFALLFVLQLFNCDAQSVTEDATTAAIQINDDGLTTKDLGEFSRLIVKRWADKYSSLANNGIDPYRTARDNSLNENPLILVQRTKYHNPKWVQMLCNLAESGPRSKSNYKESVWNKNFIKDFLNNHRSYMKPRELENIKKLRNVYYNEIPLIHALKEIEVDRKIYWDAKNSKSTPKQTKGANKTKSEITVLEVDLSKPQLFRKHNAKNLESETVRAFAGKLVHDFKKHGRQNIYSSKNGFKMSVPSSPLFPQPFAYNHKNIDSIDQEGIYKTSSLDDTLQLPGLTAQWPPKRRRKIDGLKFFNRVCSYQNCYGGGWETEFTNHIFKIPQGRFNRNAKITEDENDDRTSQDLENYSVEDVEW